MTTSNTRLQLYPKHLYPIYVKDAGKTIRIRGKEEKEEKERRSSSSQKDKETTKQQKKGGEGEVQIVSRVKNGVSKKQYIEVVRRVKVLNLHVDIDLTISSDSIYDRDIIELELYIIRGYKSCPPTEPSLIGVAQIKPNQTTRISHTGSLRCLGAFETLWFAIAPRNVVIRERCMVYKIISMTATLL